MSSETTLQSNSTHHASKPIQPKESQPLPRIHFDLVEQMSEQSTPSGPPTLVATSSSSLQESRQISEHFQAENGGVTHLLAIERNLLSSIEEDETELPAECASTHSVTRVSEQEVTLSFSDLAKRQVEDSVKSAEHVAHGGGCLSSMADSRVSVGAEENASTLLEFTENPSVNTGLTEVSSNKAALSVSAWEEKEGGPCIYSKTTPKSEPLIQAEVSGLLSESAMNLMPCIFFLSGVVSFSVVMQTPTALFFIGLFLVLHHL
ncbi:hypothetical protein FQA47_021434 [Oryzias melastigma]|uniref:Uncharacterized protein n=1 Tax=Oryzias melastigma TaxID=30732 RepID=A0A834C379_ORYME|nr:hypothetical protein FQA47_021434 [Oryzias melastigma]